VVDVDRLDRNLHRWQDECERVGLANRPHMKTHRSLEVARRQLQLGAVGLTCQKLGEAETMVDGGVDDVLISFNLLGAGKLERLAELMGHATIRVTADDPALLPGLASAAQAAGSELGVLVDCDTGLGRTGVPAPEAAAALAAEVAGTDGLRFDGLFTHPAPPGAAAFLAEAAARCADRSLEVPTVSAGGTPTMWDAAALRPTVTEYRAGTYVFNDLNTVASGAARLDDVAFTVQSTVVSRPALDRAVLDAGSKALAADAGRDGGHGLIVEAPGSRIGKLDEEHAYVTVAAGDELDLGQVVSVVPIHVCVVTNLYDELVVARGGEPVERWPVDARGKSR
jgi:D-serine deaminase-like pyridoxal phosphate-dependent protein